MREYVDHDNADKFPFETWEQAHTRYLEMGVDWTPVYPRPVLKQHDHVYVVRDDLIVGTKARAADHILSKCKHDTIVYCQPRVGLAGVSLIDAAKHHGKKVVLFMPACHRISTHQACCVERGAAVHFKRIAAMPNLAKAAREWAADNGAYFVPLGLKHPLATSALVWTAYDYIVSPERAWCAISTGVLCRALQIAWPSAEVTAVSVARNLKAGELGRADFIAEPLPFYTAEKPENLPPFPSVATYDAKVWKYIDKSEYIHTVFWNVGTEPVLQDKMIPERIDSWREW